MSIRHPQPHRQVDVGPRHVVEHVLRVLRWSSAWISSRTNGPADAVSASVVGINAVHVGLGANASRRSSKYKARLGPMAYGVAAMIEGVTHAPHRMRIHSDGVLLDQGKVLMAAVALGRTIGAGTVLSEAPATQNPEADLLVFSGGDPAARVALGRAMLGGAPSGRRHVTTGPVSSVTFRSEQPMAVNVDGEDEGDREELEVEVLPGAWTALLPDVGETAAWTPSRRCRVVRPTLKQRCMADLALGLAGPLRRFMEDVLSPWPSVFRRCS
jgi:hypothetical protein